MNTARELEGRYVAPLVDEGLVHSVSRLARQRGVDVGARPVESRRRGTVAEMLRVFGGKVPSRDLQSLVTRPLDPDDPDLPELVSAGANFLVAEPGLLPGVVRVLGEVSRKVGVNVLISPADKLGGPTLAEIDAAVSPWRREEGASIRGDRGVMECLRRLSAEAGISAQMRRRLIGTLLHDDPAALLKFMLYHLSSAEDPEVLAVAALARALKRKGLEVVDFAAFLEVMEWLARNKERGAVRVESGTMLERGLKIMSRLGYMIVKPVGPDLYDLAVNSALLSTSIKNPELMVLMRGMLEEFSG